MPPSSASAPRSPSAQSRPRLEGRFPAPVKGWAGGARRPRGKGGVTIETGPLPDAWAHEPLPERRVLVLAYGCRVETPGRMAYGAEHTALGSFGVDALGETELPAG